MIGRRNNGQFAPVSLAAELDAVKAEIAKTERAGLPLDDRIDAAEAEFAACEQQYRTNGFVTSPVPAEQQKYQRASTIGALMVIARAELLKTERERITRQFEAAGGFGLSNAEKSKQLGELQQRRRQLLAQLELQWRKQEADGGELVADARRSPEMFLLTEADLEKEAA